MKRRPPSTVGGENSARANRTMPRAISNPNSVRKARISKVIPSRTNDSSKITDPVELPESSFTVTSSREGGSVLTTLAKDNIGSLDYADSPRLSDRMVGETLSSGAQSHTTKEFRAVHEEVQILLQKQAVMTVVPQEDRFIS